MKTVGNLLKEARSSKKLTLDQVEQGTKIRKKFLEAIEGDDYAKLPSLSYAKGFVKNYSTFLGLNTNTILAFFRRQIADTSKSSILPKGIAEPLNASFFQLTPGKFLSLFVAGLIVVFLFYFGMQYRRLQMPPTLIVSTPADGAVVINKRIDVIGRTDPNATVTINGVSVLIRTDGEFFDQVTLEPGKNILTITATSRYGKTIKLARNVSLQNQ